MRPTRLRLLLTGLVLLAAGGMADLARPARAQEQTDRDGLESTVRAAHPREVPLADHPGFGTTIATDVAAESVASADELLDRSVGVSARSFGGLGDFATVSVRGGAANQVLVLLDGVSLNGGATGEVNVNLVPAELLAGIDVYRSGAPVWLGAAPLGAAVDLRTRRSRRADARLALSYGSFDSWRAFGAASGPLGAGGSGEEPDWSGLLGVQYFGSAGDFTYYDDVGTPYNLADDRERARQNNASRTGAALGRLRWVPAENLHLDLVQVASLADRGVPGTGQSPTTRTRADQWRSLTLLALEAPARLHADLDVSGQVFVDAAHHGFADPAGELGLGAQQTSNEALVFGTRWRATHFVTSAWQADWAVEARGERYRPGEAATTSRDALAPSLQLTARLADERLILSAGARADAVWSEPFAGTGAEPARFDLPWSAQGGARVALLEGSAGTLALQGSGGRFERMPTFLEMFGDQGAIRGNPALLPESAAGGDLGLAWSGAEAPVDAILAVFHYRYDDLIQFFQNSQLVARPENVAGARVDGLELAATWRVRPWLQLHGSYTLLESEDESALAGQVGNALPGRPRHTVFASALASVEGLSAEYGVGFETEHAVDRAGYLVTGARHLHGARLAYRPAWGHGLGLSVDAANLLDQRSAEVPILPQPAGGALTTRRAIADFLGFPLPGRTLFVTLSWELPS